MYRNKKDVDKHVESLISKLPVKDFKSRAYSVARLYFDVGDYVSCQRYVEQYLAQKDNNAAAHKLLGQALQKLGQKEKALDHYKTSLDIDPTQTSTILDICELLADDEVAIDLGRAKYWCKKAEAVFPRHPVTFRVRERLVTIGNPDPEALANLLTSELAVRSKDAILHTRLLKHYLCTNQFKEAIVHSCDVEFDGNTFINNYTWYDTLTEIVKHNLCNTNDWLHQLLLLTVKERICVLSLTETPSGSSKSLTESNELLHAYDQAIECVTKAGAPSGYAEFHSSLLHHHRGQFAFHAATYLLKKAKKDQLSWRDATQFAAPLMLIAWQTVPLDSKVDWLSLAPEKQKSAVHRWFTEGTYRCSQSGHYLLGSIQDKSQSFLDRISQCCSGSHWREKLYEKLFTNRDHLVKIKSSHFSSNACIAPILRLPRKIEVEAYDGHAQREYANSLHHFVWMLSDYKNYADFKCTLFDTLTPTANTCGPETLNKFDLHAFLYCAALTVRQQKSDGISYVITDKPNMLPANITDLLCTLPQMKWWDCAYKFCQNELGAELTDIRATLSRGIEVVRCVDNHGLDPELLCILGSIFSERAKFTTSVDEKNNLETRAGLYYSSAIPLLEKLKSKIYFKTPLKRMFDYIHKEIGKKTLNSLLEESKLYVAVNHLNDCEYEKVIGLLSNLKSAQAYYYLSQTYKKIALEERNLTGSKTSIDINSKYALLCKAKSLAFSALERLKDTELNKNHPLYSETQQLIDELETNVNKLDPDLSNNIVTEVDGKYSSDENISTVSEHVPLRYNHHALRNFSSTPKHISNANLTNYRTAADSQAFDATRVDQQCLERIENQIKNFQEQAKDWFDENNKMGTQIINTFQSDIQNTNDQLKLLKISVDQVKDQIDECRNECKDVGDLRKQIAELKMEVNKLKKTSSEQTIDESDLYNLDEDYRTNDSASTFTAQLPFQAPQVMPQFNQRLIPPFPVPPNPFQLYSQNLYNLYNQYSQFAQASSIPGATPLFDPTRTPVNFSGVYPTPEQMYLDVANLVPPTTSTAATVPPVPTLPTVSTAQVPSTSSGIPKAVPTLDAKDTPRSLPVNVVITSSDPLPTCTTIPTPILSVTIPSKHIKGTPHNYQIQMPPANGTNVMSPPVFNFPAATGNKATTTTASPLRWPQSTIFGVSQNTNVTSTTASGADSLFCSKVNLSFDNSKSAVVGASPNTSLNKSRTLSERSNTSVENYDPCPDFKPIIPLPAEVKVMTGEEDETVIFNARAKLFRFTEKQWKERGIGKMKLLKHKNTGKVRVLMRREQIHKICANHIITSEMEIKPMKNETKAYFWVANDFADETVVLEKFCIRFKTADIAQQFYDAFDAARRDCKESVTTPKIDDSAKVNIPKPIPSQFSTPLKNANDLPIVSQQAKTEFGGFTFSSKPTFKTVSDNAIVDKPSESVTNKTNIFSGLTFKTTNSSPFSNIFTAPSQSKSGNSVDNQETLNKLNSSDGIEEFEPNVEFKPLVPLPALVDQKTGEEDETVLYEHRAKLLRFDALSKEWKERGLGNIKLLVHKENIQKLRLLMRREQIMKVCCNHAITKEMIFQKMPNMDKAVTWCAKDFSDGELVAETLCLRFKTVQSCDNFIEAIKTAQLKLKDDSKAAKEEQNAAKQGIQIGFGDKFKPKPGSWHCDACYTNNLESFSKCACCEQPRPQTRESESSTSKANWGDKFKPKFGSWECNACFVRNEAGVKSCSACNIPKDSNVIIKSINVISDNTPKFNFGIPANTNTARMDVSTKMTLPGWGDKFKPKEGTWECKQCLIRNETDVEKCIACSSINPNTITKQEDASVFVSVTSGPKFNFGILPTLATSNEPKLNTETASIFDGTGAHTFSFGIPSNNEENIQNVISVRDEKSPSFVTPKPPIDSDGTANLIKNDDANKPMTPIKPALLPTPQVDSASFGAKESGTFDFVFKLKSPSKGKSPIKSPNSQKEDDSDGNEYASEDEGHHIHFSPVVPMPDKVDVVTGEENEDELYGHRAKLFRFLSGEWKERGLGVVKILKHKQSGKIRVVMRREQVLKICLNHALIPEISYTPKDEKTWFFAANDFSDGELSLQQFCLRFQSKEIALEFKEVIDKVREGKTVVKNDSESDKKENNNDDVIFVKEIQATTEEKQRAKELMLPENFFTYKNKEPCQGCRGCKGDEEELQPQMATNKRISILKAPLLTTPSIVSTPLKTSTPSFQSPTNSLYGTPANFDKTIDTSIFRTPLGSLAPNTHSSSLLSFNNSISGNDSTNKENTFIQKNIFTGQYSGITTPQSTPTNLFGAGDTDANVKSGILPTPKLNTSETTEVKPQDAEYKSVFGGTQNKSIFGDPQANSLFKSTSLLGSTNLGVSTNKSLFDRTIENTHKPEVKSLFGAEDQSPVNLFSNAAKGSLFGPGALANSQPKQSTGSNGVPVFDSGTPQTVLPIKHAVNQAPTWTLGHAGQEKSDVTVTKVSNEKNIEEVKATEELKVEAPFKVDNSLSFAALSSSEPEFNIQKKPDFKWEGAGQQLFTSAQKSNSKDAEGKSKTDIGAGDAADSTGADEEYDPHYEPIVPLPDKIVVTTGEEDEEKLFGERCKLYRYDEKTREWKERGVGEMKILYHPEKKTYRLLLRREQVHKAVLNMLLFMDLELFPMKNSDRAWTWAGRNFAEIPSGQQETLAVRFKSVDLSIAFRDRVVECSRKLQAAAAQAIEQKEPEKPFVGVAPLRLPKHLADSARADPTTPDKAVGLPQLTATQSQGRLGNQNGQTSNPMPSEIFKQVQFQEAKEEVHVEEVHEEEAHEEDEDDDDYDHDYDQNEDYEAYYNEDDEETATYYACDGEATVRQGDTHTHCEHAHVQVLFDQIICAPKILVTDADTGEILVDMLIHTDTEFQMTGHSCSWMGTDYTTNPMDMSVTVNFFDAETAIQFYDSCETSKGATYSSTDPES